MTHEQFNNFQDNLLAECVAMKNTKGKEYANPDSRLANFDRLAAQLGLTNVQVAWVYTTKHLDAIASFCRTGQVLSEPIRGRIIDAIVYLTLIAGMAAEANEIELISGHKYEQCDGSYNQCNICGFPKGAHRG